MSNWNEISDSLKASLYDRGKSPFYGAFIISWLGWNWRLIFSIIGTGKQDFEKRIEIVNQNYVGWMDNLIYPLVTAALVFTVGNFLTSLFLRFKYQFSNYRRDKIQKLDLLDEKQTQEMWKKLGEKEIEINRMLTDKIAEIESMKLINQEINKENIELKQEQVNIDTLKNEVENLKKELHRKEQRLELNKNAIKSLEKENNDLKQNHEDLDEFVESIDENYKDELLKNEYKKLKTSDYYNSFLTLLFVMATEISSTFSIQKLTNLLDVNKFSNRDGFIKIDDLRKIEILDFDKKYDIVILNHKGKKFVQFFLDETKPEDISFSYQNLVKSIK